MAFGVVTAGGKGSRLGLDSPKLEVPVLGIPLILYSLRAFEDSGSIEMVVLAVPPERVDAWSVQRLRGEGVTKVARTIAGGATRQESVRLALATLPAGGGTVVIHDGARPCVTPALIEAVSDVPDGAAGVITAIPVTDTIKEVDSGSVVRTLERERLASVQTPQSFPLDEIRRAHEAALAHGFEGTDDASLVEWAGGTVKVVGGSRDNIKVTYAEDVARAEWIIGRRTT